jgi:AcrR family transcriptional regulator
VQRRHAATRQEILDAAWRLARERGLGGWSLRDVAGAVGMRAPSLYGYFASKNAVFDAMFTDGYLQLQDHLARVRSRGGRSARGAAAPGRHGVRRLPRRGPGPVPAALPAHPARLRADAGRLRPAVEMFLREHLPDAARDQPG